MPQTRGGGVFCPKHGRDPILDLAGLHQICPHHSGIIIFKHQKTSEIFEDLHPFQLLVVRRETLLEGLNHPILHVIDDK